LGEEALSRFQTLDFLALDALSRGQILTESMKARLPALVDAGAVESVGRGKGMRFFLSRELYQEMGEPGSYTRRKGLDHETNKALLIQHLSNCGGMGAPMKELEQVLPAQSRTSIRRMLSELQGEGRVVLVGTKSASRWLFNVSYSDRPV
jgi:ATP-dependent DNA helicase RecG